MAAKSIHIRIDHNESVDGRRILLSSEINFLKLLKKIRIYQKERRKEFILKTGLKKEISLLKKEIYQLLEILPTEQQEVKTKERKKQAEEEQEHKRDIEYQLRDIQEKLAKLN